MNAYKNLVRFALNNNAVISVFDGEVWSTKRSSNYKEIVEDIEGVEEAELKIRDKDGNQIGWALVTAYGVDPEETVSDYTETPFMESWARACGLYEIPFA